MLFFNLKKFNVDDLILKEEVLIIDIKYNLISLDLIKTLFYIFFSVYVVFYFI